MSDRVLSIVLSIFIAVIVSVVVTAVPFTPVCARVGLPWYCGIPFVEWLLQ